MSSTEKLKQTMVVQMKPDRPENVMADYVVDEFKNGFKTLCEIPKMAFLIPLIFGVLPSVTDLFSDFILGVSYIMDGDYVWGGKKF